MAFVYAWIVPLWAAQLLPQLLMEQFDNLRIQCRHIEHMHEGVYNFCLHRFYQNLLSKLRSAGLNYNSPSFFTESYCAGGGVSNKHCLFTFFHFLAKNRKQLFFSLSKGVDQLACLLKMNIEHLFFQSYHK